MRKETVLIVDDEEDTLEVVSYNLAREGYDVRCVNSGEDALSALRSQLPHLVLLDLMLPGVDGLEVCKTLKNDLLTQHIPVIMLTAKSEEVDVVIGLELGADDYIAKPFSMRILKSRIKAVLRRQKKEKLNGSSLVKIHDLVIDPSCHEVLVQGNPIGLTLTEFRILHYLVLQRGRVVTRDQFLFEIQGEDHSIASRSVDVHIVMLRKKLEETGRYIETVRGIGYRFKE